MREGAERRLATGCDCHRDRSLRQRARSRLGIVEGPCEPRGAPILGASLHGEDPLTDSRCEALRIQPLCDVVLAFEPTQAGRCQDDRVDITLLHPAQSCVDVPSDVANVEIRAGFFQKRPPTRAPGANA